MRPIHALVIGFWILMGLFFAGTALSAAPEKCRTYGNATRPFDTSNDVKLTKNVDSPPPEPADNPTPTAENNSQQSSTEDNEEDEDDDEWEA